MKYRYEDENTVPLIEGSAEEIKEEEPIEQEVKSDASEEDEYYELPSSIKSRSRIWSVLSLVCGILSVLLSPFYVAGLILAAASVGFAILSRRVLGFFDKLALVGLTVGICGFVFGVFSMIASLSGVTDALFKK